MFLCVCTQFITYNDSLEVFGKNSRLKDKLMLDSLCILPSIAINCVATSGKSVSKLWRA